MSMVLYVRRATDAQLDEIRANPSSISDFFFNTGALESGDLIDFDKAWQAVHFTLSGAEYYTSDPLGALLSEGETVGEDMGYGAAWIIPAGQMASFNQALNKLTDESIRARFDPQALAQNDIYSFEDCMEYQDDALKYLMQGIPALREFANHCATSNSSALVAIC